MYPACLLHAGDTSWSFATSLAITIAYGYFGHENPDLTWETEILKPKTVIHVVFLKPKGGLYLKTYVLLDTSSLFIPSGDKSIVVLSALEGHLLEFDDKDFLDGEFYTC